MEDEIELANEPELELVPEQDQGEKIEVSDMVYWGFSVDASTAPSDALIQWYANLPSQRLDLVAELGDSRGMFVVSGEALIMHVIEHLCGGTRNFKKDKLLLAATFYVEKYLDMFITAKNGRNGIRVVFMDCLCPLLASMGEAVALFREVLVNHLLSNFGPKIVQIFPDWSSESFSKFVTESDISSFIVCDELCGFDDSSIDEGDRVMQSLFLSMALHLVTAFRVRIAFLDQLEQRGHRIVAFSIGADRRHELVHSKVMDAIQPFFEELRESADDQPNLTITCNTQLLAQGIAMTLSDLESLDSPEAQAVVSVLKIAMLTCAASQCISLEDRCHVTVSDWSIFDPESGLFEQVWSQVADNVSLITRALTRSIVTNDGVGEFNTEIADLFDGRLFRTITYVLWKSGVLTSGDSQSTRQVLGFPASVVSNVESVWAEFVEGVGDVFAIQLDISEGPSEDLNGVSMNSVTTELVGFSHPNRLLDRAKSVAASMPGGESLVDRLKQVPEVTAPAVKPQMLGSYIPETQLVTKRFADKKKKDYEDQKAKWKHLSIDKLASRMRTWELRSAQKELRAMHQYAKSLVGADCLHHPIALVQEGRKQRAQVASEEEEIIPAGPKMSKKAMEIIARNRAAQEKTQANKDSDQIKPLIERAEAIADCRDFKQFESALFDLCSGYSRILDSFDGFKGIAQSVKLEASQVKVIAAVVKSCKSVLKRLAPSASGHMATEEAKLGLRNACAKILRLCVSFVQEYAKEMDGKEITRVQELLLSMGFSHISKNVFNVWLTSKQGEEASEAAPAAKEKKSKKDKDEKKTKKSTSPEETDWEDFYVKSSKVDAIADVTGGDEYLFQLVHLSWELDRPAGTQSDKRVMFKPDYWQKELLDIVDSNESALVCAPTASGKTFICYYAMEKVLRTSNDKVAVYVAPSKALMNQVDAEIYARFRSKTYPATEHFHLSGDLEKDYQHNPFDCQVLVTVPGMLEQLLLDPTMQDWVRRIEYVIFDEVHCMGENAEEAAIWEHALQLIPCPFLAMSATVGNPSKFHDWLNHVARIKGGPKVHLIEYKERFNDLQKFAFSPNDSALLSVHPLTLLSYEDVMSGVIPPDLCMTPAETALLSAALSRAVVESATEKSEAEDAVKKLAPRKVFEKSIAVSTMVTKRQFREYERYVLSEFIRLSETGFINRSVFDKLQSALALSPRIGEAKSVNELWSMMSKSGSKSSATAVNVVEALKADISTHYLDGQWLYNFLRQMDTYSLLPAIIFNLDRAEIVKMVERLSSLLKQGQYEKFYGSEERAYATRAINKKRMDAYEAKVARQRMMERKNKKDEDFDEAEISESVPLPVMVEDEFDPEFSFAGVKAMSDPECHELIDKLAETKKIKPWIIEALRRGIGMHHEGCSTRLKKTVEILFRRGFLRIVVATSTLSLGINMPCKSTIFVGTHVKLNALNYRQMAGRAGRRGFDLVGQVIFVDSTQKNIRRLLSSELSQLGGDYALTPSHVLRAQIMMDHLIQSNSLTDKIERHLMAMLLGGFMPFNVGASSASIAILRSNFDFLLREGLLNANGQVTRLGSLAAFLFKREPENMIVSRVLLSRDLLGEIDRWLGSELAEQPTSMATFKLMQVLSAFCFNKPLLRGAGRRVIPARKRLQPTATCPVMPPIESFLPETLCDIREKFNQRVIDNVVSRILMMTQERVSESILPASNRRVGSHTSALESSSEMSKVISQQKIPAVVVRSPFAALAGKGDKFDSASDLVMSASQRPELMLDSASVPTVRRGLVSSYSCDFMLHGKLSLLQNDCLIGISESWKDIDEWRFFLESLNIALEFMFELDNTHEYAHLQKVVRDLTAELSLKLHLEGA